MHERSMICGKETALPGLVQRLRLTRGTDARGAHAALVFDTQQTGGRDARPVAAAAAGLPNLLSAPAADSTPPRPAPDADQSAVPALPLFTPRRGPSVSDTGAFDAGSREHRALRRTLRHGTR